MVLATARRIVRFAASVAGIRRVRRDPPLTETVCPLRVPLPLGEGEPWKADYLFAGSTTQCAKLTCHASALVPGCCPHPPHAHAEEEILLLLGGEADLVLPDDPEGRRDRRRLAAGGMVFYPANHPHTLEAVGGEPANYLMFKWTSGRRFLRRGLRFGEFTVGGLAGGHPVADGFRMWPVFEGRTGHLRKLHCHVSMLEPGAGYEPHVDGHDVALILLEGRVQTAGGVLDRPAVAFFPAGEPHGLRNAGQTPARYVVLEFHG